MTEMTSLLKIWFDPQMPFYLNYWVIYLAIAILIAAIFVLQKKYTVRRMAFAVGCNMTVGVIMLFFIANRM